MRRWACIFLLVLATGAACSAFSGSDGSTSAGADGGGVGADGGPGAGGEGGTVDTDGGAIEGDASPEPDAGLGGVGVPIDCSMVAAALFCNAFDGRPGESMYTPSNGNMDAGVSAVHAASPPGALHVQTLVYVTFDGGTPSKWTIAFDVWLDASTPTGATFATISKSPSRMDFTTTASGFLAGATKFTTGPGWTHITVTYTTGSTAQVSAGGFSQPVGFAATGATTLQLSLGNIGPDAKSLWFDDVIATSP